MSHIPCPNHHLSDTRVPHSMFCCSGYGGIGSKRLERESRPWVRALMPLIIADASLIASLLTQHKGKDESSLGSHAKNPQRSLA